MPNREMDAIQVQDAVVGEQPTLAPGFILLGQRAVETTDGAGTGGDSRERLSHLSHLMRAHSTHKHLGERFGHLGFIAAVALEDLAVKLPFPVPGDFERLHAPGGRDQVACIGPIAIATTRGRAFAPRGSDALLQFFTHDLFDQDLDGAHGQTPYMLTKFLLLWYGG